METKKLGLTLWQKSVAGAIVGGTPAETPQQMVHALACLKVLKDKSLAQRLVDENFRFVKENYGGVMLERTSAMKR